MLLLALIIAVLLIGRVAEALEKREERRKKRSSRTNIQEVRMINSYPIKKEVTTRTVTRRPDVERHRIREPQEKPRNIRKEFETWRRNNADYQRLRQQIAQRREVVA